MSTTRFHVIGKPDRKSPTRAIHSDVRREIRDRLVLHGDSLRRVAKQNGIAEDDALDVLIGELRQEAAAMERRGFLKGQQSMFRPLPPGAAKAA